MNKYKILDGSPKKKNGKRKADFGITAAIIGAAVTVGSAIYQGQQQKKAKLAAIAEENRANAEIDAANRFNNLRQTELLQQSSIDGMGRKSLYGMGGPAKGLTPIGDEAYEVKAGTHESGNDLDIGPVIVEGQEVVNDKGVYSNRILKNGKSFAKQAKGLEIIKRKLEESGPRGQQVAAAIDSQLQNLMREQEIIKDKAGIEVDGSKPVAAYGLDDDEFNLLNPKDKRLKALQSGYEPYSTEAKLKLNAIGKNNTPGLSDRITPDYRTLLDLNAGRELGFTKAGNSQIPSVTTNPVKTDVKSTDTQGLGTWIKDNQQGVTTGINMGANLVATGIQMGTLNSLAKMKPAVRKPMQYVRQNTDINVNPQLTDIDEATANTRAFVRDNMTNAAAKNSLVALSNIEAAKAKTEVRTKEQLMELELKNNELSRIEDVTNRNINRRYQDEENRVAYERGILTNKAGMVNQLNSNLTSMVKDVNLQNLDSDKLKIMMSKYGDTEVGKRLLEELVDQLNGAGTYKKLLAEMGGK